jgi:hypothetical protein
LPPEWRSLSQRNTVRIHNGMVFGFRPESRSSSTGFPTDVIVHDLRNLNGSMRAINFVLS